MTRLRYGTVATFDDDKGYGTIRDEDGTEHFFHCTAIADGSRTIPVESRVVFVLVPGRLGRWEAADVNRLDGEVART